MCGTARPAAAGDKMAIPGGGKAIWDQLKSGGTEHSDRELYHLAGGPAPAGRTGAQASGAEAPKRADAGDPGLLTGYRVSGGSWTG